MIFVDISKNLKCLLIFFAVHLFNDRSDARKKQNNINLEFLTNTFQAFHYSFYYKYRNNCFYFSHN